jgi:hypothetical protein
MKEAIHSIALASSGSIRTAPARTSESNSWTCSGEPRRSQAASVNTGHVVIGASFSRLNSATHGPWCSSRSERIATSGPVSIRTASATAEPVEMCTVRAQIRRRILDCTDQTGTFCPLEWRALARFFRGGLRCILEPLDRAPEHFRRRLAQFASDRLDTPHQRVIDRKTLGLRPVDDHARSVSALPAERHRSRAVYGHPVANFTRKHPKSARFSTGGVVLPSQFAHGSPDAYRTRKQLKSCTLITGGEVELSQLG